MSADIMQSARAGNAAHPEKTKRRRLMAVRSPRVVLALKKRQMIARQVASDYHVHHDIGMSCRQIERTVRGFHGQMAKAKADRLQAGDAVHADLRRAA